MAAEPTKRDPRVNPKAGDVFRNEHNVGLIGNINLLGGVFMYWTQQSPRWIDLDDFRKMASAWELIYAAE